MDGEDADLLLGGLLATGLVGFLLMREGLGLWGLVPCAAILGVVAFLLLAYSD